MQALKSKIALALVAAVLLSGSGLVWWGGAQPAGKGLDADAIGTAAGTKATTNPDGVVRLAWARTDVKVEIDGLAFKPAAGLGSWAAFTAMPHGAMVMGDTVVFEDEVTPALDAAFYFMHLGGRGEPGKLAAGVKGVWDAIKKVRAEHAAPARRFPGKVPAGGTVEASVVEKVLGHKAETQKDVVKVTIGREGKMHGVKVAGSMGLTTWAAFTGSDELAAVDGDFIMAATEVQPVLRALRHGGLHVVALHNHMIGEEPAFYFVHYWGKGPARELAQGLKTALDAQQQAARKGAAH
jgi:Domain of Unknown Function (DUF1259)